MLTAKVFKCGNSQAIRIPSEMKTTQTEFYIQKSGELYHSFWNREALEA